MSCPDFVPAIPRIFLLKSPTGTFIVNSGFLSNCDFVNLFSLTKTVNIVLPHSIPRVPHEIVIVFTLSSALVVSKTPVLTAFKMSLA